MNKLVSVSTAIALGAVGLASVGSAQAASSKLAPQNVPGPGAKALRAAPDGTLGMALLAAHVGSTGTLISSAGGTGVIKIGVGTYEVDFNRDVSGCFYTASSFTNTVPVFVEPRSGNVNGVFLEFFTLGTTSTDPAATDSEFYLQVFCVR